MMFYRQYIYLLHASKDFRAFYSIYNIKILGVAEESLHNSNVEAHNYLASI